MRVFKKIFILILSFCVFLFMINCRSYCFMENNCSSDEVYDLVSDNRNTFDLDSGTISLNTTTTGNFYYPYAQIDFLFTSTERQFIKLNYSGPMAKLKVYNYYYYNTNDYLFYSQQISYDQDIIYCDVYQTYVLEFESNTYNTGSFTLYPIKVTSTNLSTHEKFFMHITYDSTSSLGYRYDVEYKNLDLASATPTTEYINLDGGVTSYLDLISSTLNFNISNDARYLVSNPGELQYSAIAYAGVTVRYINSSGTSVRGYRGTGTFVDETTVLSCAHLFYNLLEDSNDSFNLYSAISHNIYFYPGANSYYNSLNYYQNFGKYKGIETYLPISYILYDMPNINQYETEFTYRTGYDWSITLTENIIGGTYEHSYMGMYTLTSDTNYAVQSAGYPGLEVCPDNEVAKYHHSMWASIPLYNEVEISPISNNVYVSETIRSSGGNSGGPVYVYVTAVQNGQILRYCSIMGILDAAKTPSGNFVHSLVCKIRPVIINLYYEVI